MSTNKEANQYYFEPDYKDHKIVIYIHPDFTCSAEIRNLDGAFVTEVNNCENYDTAIACAKHEIDCVVG